MTTATLEAAVSKTTATIATIPHIDNDKTNSNIASSAAYNPPKHVILTFETGCRAARAGKSSGRLCLDFLPLWQISWEEGEGTAL